jgi:hypothetical protein
MLQKRDRSIIRLDTSPAKKRNSFSLSQVTCNKNTLSYLKATRIRANEKSFTIVVTFLEKASTENI